ncbi:hypothetical protein EV641_103362 [Rhodococcus sp. SMB37]|uniref:hypothetical protein n=1 Tax=Rhodococcus sp. SMB37 TaxID=2512213 RepID=UPI0010D3C451|nr:hypothetical protein [Rhodococcus sp. SMB37]TCN56014.1 hypothetical protein EV641_103362 [Rhodococcus sp. SMB37]
MRTSARVLLATAAIALASAGTATAAPTPIVDGNGTIVAPNAAQISFAHTPSGTRAGTANEHESRAGVSIVKLYLAEYVVRQGDPADQADAVEMIRAPDDSIADRLHAKYPQAISTTAAEFGLVDTHVPGYWGFGTTSTHDMVTYLEAKKRTDPGSPVLGAMASAHETAADGYPQNFGTALLAGVIGTKWGWSDDRSFHASASFGPDFSVAASVYGSASQLTDDVLGAFTEGAPSPAEHGYRLADCPAVAWLADDPALSAPAQALLDAVPPQQTAAFCGV